MCCDILVQSSMSGSIVALAIRCDFVGNESSIWRTQIYRLIISCDFTRHGPQGMHNEASKATLEYEFGTSNEREVISHILEKGEIQETIVRNNLSTIQWSRQINRYPYSLICQHTTPCSRRKALTIRSHTEFWTPRNQKRIPRITRHPLRSLVKAESGYGLMTPNIAVSIKLW